MALGVCPMLLARVFKAVLHPSNPTSEAHFSCHPPQDAFLSDNTDYKRPCCLLTECLVSFHPHLPWVVTACPYGFTLSLSLPFNSKVSICPHLFHSSLHPQAYPRV